MNPEKHRLQEVMTPIERLVTLLMAEKLLEIKGVESRQCQDSLQKEADMTLALDAESKCAGLALVESSSEHTRARQQ